MINQSQNLYTKHLSSCKPLERGSWLQGFRSVNPRTNFWPILIHPIGLDLSDQSNSYGFSHSVYFYHHKELVKNNGLTYNFLLNQNRQNLPSGSKGIQKPQISMICQQDMLVGYVTMASQLVLFICSMYLPLSRVNKYSMGYDSSQTSLV